jgi:hypothetical protein
MQDIRYHSNRITGRTAKKLFVAMQSPSGQCGVNFCLVGHHVLALEGSLSFERCRYTRGGIQLCYSIRNGSCRAPDLYQAAHTGIRQHVEIPISRCRSRYQIHIAFDAKKRIFVAICSLASWTDKVPLVHATTWTTAVKPACTPIGSNCHPLAAGASLAWVGLARSTGSKVAARTEERRRYFRLAAHG